MDLPELTDYLDGLLRTAEIPDFPRAHNGLQVEGDRPISRVVFAVDASQATIDEAVRCRADLLVVHHGLFWDGRTRLTGRAYRRIKTLLGAGIAVYSSHLPLDVHPDVGNNAVLARQLGMTTQGSFGEYQGCPLGVWGFLEIRREALAARLDELLGCRIRMIAGGPERLKRVGIITGGAASYIGEAQAAGLDAFITGEGAHHNFFDAVEGGVNLLLGGHYATETWGVRALAEHLQERFPLECSFIDLPTGL